MLDGRLALLRQDGALANAGKELIQLPFMLHAPNGDDPLLQLHPCRGSKPIADQTARHSLHCDEAHLFFTAAVEQLLFLYAGEIAVRKLQRRVKSGVDRLLRHGEAVIRDADVPDLPLLFRLQSRVIESVLSVRLRTEGRIVELVEIDIVGFQCAQTRFKVFP